jgi:catechol 2,3-dioxygenase-like lactoylglutathione lyase family enzyme
MALPVKNVDEAIPFYQTKMGFRLESRLNTPIQSAILARDSIKIGLAENGGDPTQEGCFFEVDNIDAAFEEINGVPPADGAIKLQSFGKKSFRVFFVVAPDGLCYMLGQAVL